MEAQSAVQHYWAELHLHKAESGMADVAGPCEERHECDLGPEEYISWFHTGGCAVCINGSGVVAEWLI